MWSMSNVLCEEEERRTWFEIYEDKSCSILQRITFIVKYEIEDTESAERCKGMGTCGLLAIVFTSRQI